MKYLGGKSMASFINTLIQIFKAVLICFEAVFCILFSLSLIKYAFVPGLPGIPLGGMSMEVPGMGITIPADSPVMTSSAFPVILNGFIAIWIGFAIFILNKLKAVFGTLENKTPFVHENAVRIQKIGFSVIVLSFIQPLYQYIVNHYMLEYVYRSDVNIGTRVTLLDYKLFLGLIILVIAEVFRHGSKLQDDSDLTA